MTHYDCRYFLATDVFKGICKRDKNNIIADDAACADFEQARKCKNCSNFTLTSVDLGMCMNKYESYPEMNAVTCNEYKQQ